jgi:hypothetical protein
MLFAPQEGESGTSSWYTDALSQQLPGRSRVITVNCEPNPQHSWFCGAGFTQRQGLTQHIRMAHDIKSCL